MTPLRLLKSPAPARTSDAELIASILGGDRDAAETLFRRHHAMVAGLAFRLLGSDSEVDDVAQDAFVEALRSLSRLGNPQAFAAWIGSIVVRVVGKKLRRRRLLEKLGLRRREGIDVDAFVSPFCPEEVAAELRSVYRVVGRLSPEARLALVLLRVEGLTIEEAAERMQLSMATVKRRLVEAETRLNRSRGVPS